MNDRRIHRIPGQVWMSGACRVVENGLFRSAGGRWVVEVAPVSENRRGGGTPCGSYGPVLWPRCHRPVHSCGVPVPDPVSAR